MENYYHLIENIIRSASNHKIHSITARNRLEALISFLKDSGVETDITAKDLIPHGTYRIRGEDEDEDEDLDDDDYSEDEYTEDD